MASRSERRTVAASGNQRVIVPTMEVLDLTAGYSKLPIVQSVTMSVESGQVTALIGPNGSGKSTLLKAILGIVWHTGKVSLKGQSVGELPPHDIARRGLAYVPQVRNVFPSMTVLENLEIGGRFDRARVQAGTLRAFEMFPDLRVAAKKRAGVLSGGQRIMLSIAKALMLEPAAIMLDEPTAGLAPILVDRVWEHLENIARAGAAVLVVEQNVDRALEHSDLVNVLVAGRLVISGPPSEMRMQNLGSIFLGAKPAPIQRGDIGETQRA